MFDFSTEQQILFDEWMKSQHEKAVALQKQQVAHDDSFYDCYSVSWKEGYPYTGAIGGGLTYHITPTNLGPIIKVSYILTGDEIDLTDYDMW
jgi:hypothetical protein